MLIGRHCQQELFVLESKKGDFSENQGWKNVSTSKKSYRINGNEYYLVEKKERNIAFSSAERISRIALGVLCCMLTLCIALCSKTVRQFFTGREVVKIVKKKSDLDNLSEYNGFKWTKKIFNPPIGDKPVVFTSLAKNQVVKLLKICPELKEIDAANGSMKAYDSILRIFEKGIPEKLDLSSNQELKKSMQFILYKIDQEKEKKKKMELLKEVADCISDCAAVSQGSLSKMFQKLACKTHGFEEQMENFISNYKDKIIDQVLYTLYPEMQDPAYAAKHFHQPNKQFVHVKTGFLASLGDDFGTNSLGAKQDAKRNIEEPKKKGKKFKEILYQKISVFDVVKEFIIDINGRLGQFEIDKLHQWCENLGDASADIYYDENAAYPIYAAPFKKEYQYEPYLTEALSLTIFEKLGYLSNSEAVN